MNQEVDIQRGAEQLLGQALYFLLSGSIAAAGARPRFVGLANRSTSQHRDSVGQVLGGSISATPVKARPKPVVRSAEFLAPELPFALEYATARPQSAVRSPLRGLRESRSTSTSVEWLSTSLTALSIRRFGCYHPLRSC